jgi:predicted CXXCH cytochrome family protein
MKALLATFIGSLLVCSQLAAAQLKELEGAVAYTEVIEFDYTKDGARDRVQFWLEFSGSPALGTPGDAGYKPESGAIYYYLVDIDNKKQVDNWLMGFSMMEEPPPRGPYPVTDIKIRDKTATFSAFGMTWTVVDGGEGYADDEVTVNDGFQTRKMNLFGGDLQVSTSQPDAIAEFKDCVECHEKATTDLVASGGRHTKVGCSECHVGHPPEEEHSYTGCLECHEPHSDQMGEDSCGACHRAHTAAEVRHSWNVPSEYCLPCHQEVAYVLASSRSKHSDIACVRCHQDRHTEAVNCQYCHGAPHPQHVMTKPGICAACHHTAHELESAREK